MKVLAELESQLDDLDGWGQLLIKDCVETDGEVVQHRVNELRYYTCMTFYYSIDQRRIESQQTLCRDGPYAP